MKHRFTCIFAFCIASLALASCGKNTNVMPTIPEISIGYNGNWFIDGVDTGKPSRGEQGEQGEKGEPGAPGQNGEDGKPGANGQDGKPGKNGQDGQDGKDGKDGKNPYIGKNGNWWIGDIDTKIPAKGQDGEAGPQGPSGYNGETPYIGKNGNWWIGSKDTGIKAGGVDGTDGKPGKDGVSIVGVKLKETVGNKDIYIIIYSNGKISEFIVTNGIDGQDGAQGEQGIQGIEGKPGEDGHTPVITIENGCWVIDNVNTNIKATGPQGPIGPQGPAGKDGVSIISVDFKESKGNQDIYLIKYSDGTTSEFTVTNGKNGQDGAQGEQGIQGIEGKPGEDGHTPVIKIENGFWVIDNVNTNIKATGPQGPIGPQGPAGKDGVSIINVDFKESKGNQDIYLITYSDGTTSEFTVTNGKNGQDGIQGIPGKDGHAPDIRIGKTGTWIIDNLDTKIPATGPRGPVGPQGPQGEKGEPGKDGINLEIKKVEFIKKITDTLYLYKVTYSNGTTAEVEIPVPQKEKCMVYKTINKQVIGTYAYDYGSKISELNYYQEKPDYGFLGWFVNGKKWDFDKDIITDDIVLDGKYVNFSSAIDYISISNKDQYNRYFTAERDRLEFKPIIKYKMENLDLSRYIKCYSSNVQVADFDSLGNVHLKKNGTATLHAEIGHYKDSVTINVTNKESDSFFDTVSKLIQSKEISETQSISKDRYCFEANIYSIYKNEYFLCTGFSSMVKAKDFTSSAKLSNFKIGDNVKITEAKLYNYNGQILITDANILPLNKKLDANPSYYGYTPAQYKEYCDKLKNGPTTINSYNEAIFPLCLNAYTIFEGFEPTGISNEYKSITHSLLEDSSVYKLQTKDSTSAEYLDQAKYFKIKDIIRLVGCIVGFDEQTNEAIFDVIRYENTREPSNETFQITLKDASFKVNDLIDLQQLIDYYPIESVINKPKIIVESYYTTASYVINEKGKLIPTSTGEITVYAEYTKSTGQRINSRKTYTISEGPSTSCLGSMVTDKSLSYIINNQIDESKFYKVEAIVDNFNTDFSSSVSGEGVYISDPITHEPIITYGFNSGLTAIDEKYGNAYIIPSADFPNTILNKDFNIGDKIEVILTKNNTYNDVSCTFIRNIEKNAAANLTYNLTLPEGVTASKTNNLIPGEKITLTYSGNDNLVFTDNILEKVSENTYEIIANKGPNIIKIEKNIPGFVKFHYQKPTHLDPQENIYTYRDLKIHQLKNDGHEINAYGEIRMYKNHSLEFSSISGLDVDTIVIYSLGGASFDTTEFIVEGGTLISETDKIIIKANPGVKSILIKNIGLQVRFIDIDAQFKVA